MKPHYLGVRCSAPNGLIYVVRRMHVGLQTYARARTQTIMHTSNIHNYIDNFDHGNNIKCMDIVYINDFTMLFDVFIQYTIYIMVHQRRYHSYHRYHRYRSSIAA